MGDAKRKDSWLARRREKKRRKRDRTGDSPERSAEGKKAADGADPDVTGAMARTGTTGFLGGGF